MRPCRFLSMIRGVVALLCVFLVSGVGLRQAHAQQAERILDFDSDIEVLPDASMRVTETIKVYAAGEVIKRGIYRDFPTHYTDRYGNKYNVVFSVESVRRDGSPEKFHTEPRQNGVRVYIGDPGYFLPPGEYSYAIVYQTARQLGFFDDHDELYWNVTGNGWVFPIEHVTATVRLPEGAAAQVQRAKGFTGRQGSKEEALAITQDASGNPFFESSRVLQPYEGMTIVVAWPKGYVHKPSVTRQAGYFASDNGATMLSLAGLLMILIFYLVAWYQVGRDPAKGTIIPLFHPPEGFSPATMRYLRKMGYDKKSFTAAVLSMAVKGYLKIEEYGSGGILSFGKTYTLSATGKEISCLELEEIAAAQPLMAGGQIELKQENHEIISAAMQALQRALKSKVNSIYLITNQWYFLLGLGLSGLAIFFAFIDLQKGAGPVILNFIIWAVMVVVNALFYHLLKAPTLSGRKIMDQIEGFRMFLSVTEKERLNFLNPPEKTPELFEMYLPYALALDVEQKWAEQFAGVFDRLSRENRAYHPAWYAGTWHTFEPDRFSRDLGHSFDNAIASASVAPGSSSGFGGGGGSGGGGGGGGGGGW